MFGKGKNSASQAKSRVAEVGWVIEAQSAGFIWDAPKKFARAEPGSSSAKSVRYCPAVIEHETRMYEVTCPIDVELSFYWDQQGMPRVQLVGQSQSGIRPDALARMLVMGDRKEWRHEDRPLIQIITPYHFIADEQMYLTQLPPFNHYRSPQLPGVLIGGRLPIDVWPRQMMWAFEWHDTSQNIVLKRGEPWFYVRFEPNDPSRPVRLVEAELTEDLREYLKGMSAVANYVNRTYSLFNTARSRRPAKLLVPKKRGSATADED